MATKRESYTTSEKLKIIQFAEEHGNRAAQREFGNAESNVRFWRTSKEKLQKMPRVQRADRGRKAAWPRLKQDLMAWITEKRNNGLAILPAMKFPKIQSTRFLLVSLSGSKPYKASNHWCQRFMKRNGLSLRQKTTLAQGLPPDYEEKLVQFQQFIIKQRRAHNYPLHLVGNMDESPIQFDMPSNRTVSKTGKKTVKIRTTGNEKNGLTVVLTCTGDGSKLKPLVIFKRKTMPKIGNKHGIVVAMQEKGWMDENIMKIWIEKIWRSRIGGLGRRRSLLVLDSFEAHKTEQVKGSFKSENTDFVVIPGGLTSVLQPLDVCLNKPFKDRVRQKWMEWMAEGIHKLTAGGRQKKTSEELVCQWIGKGSRDIPREMVAKSFLKCGITNALDGSEDDFIFDTSSDDESVVADDSLVTELFNDSESESDFRPLGYHHSCGIKIVKK